MRKSYRYLAAWLMACLFSLAAYSQVTLTGSVHNSSSKENSPAVSVTVKGTGIGTFTNSNGEFSLKVPKLPVVLRFTSIGYEDQEVNVTDASQPLVVDFKPTSILGQDVVLAASRTPTKSLESPVTIESMNRTVLRNLAAPNYYEAITNLKGVDMHTASLGFRTVTTRGFVASGNTRMNQLIDGMDNQAPGLNFSVGNIVGPTELDVDNVELLAGASSALYGSGGINGTVLVTSKNPFVYKGFSYNIKQGIMHVDGKTQGKPSPYYDWSFRWAKVCGKFAFKITAEMTKGTDWQANDNRNKQQIGILSKVVGGNSTNDPNFNGINMYGDETSVNIGQLAPILRDGINSAVLSGFGINLMTMANGYFAGIGNPAYPTTAQMNTFIGGFPAPLQPTVGFWLAFYNGVKNNYFPSNQNVARTGYEEKYLVDYNSLNVRTTAALHYKISDKVEASWNTYFGTGTTVYTGADRYSLRNLKIAQHKLELHGRTWFLRGYTTQENAGDSYNASALGGFLNEAWKKSVDNANLSGSWYPQFIYAFEEAKRSGVMADITAFNLARGAADVGRYLPGTTAFINATNKIKQTPIRQGGALFLDKSDLWSAEGQFNVSDALHFSDKLEMMTGVQWKQWVMNSQGTIFADTTGPIKVNEEGIYVQLKKKFFGDGLQLTGAIRYDKQTNFDGRWTPRLTALIKVAKDNHIRISYQTAYRFPSNQDQYISLVTGAGSLIGCLPQFQTFYHLNTNPGYTPESVLAYRASGNPANTSILQVYNFKPVKPETVGSVEVGYKGIVHKDFFFDAYAYFSNYKDFLGKQGLGQSLTGSPTGLFSPFTTSNISYAQNSDQDVQAYGWGIGLEYQFIPRFLLYGNVFSDQLYNVPAGLVTFFNAPKYRYNIGLRSENAFHHIGFNVVMKWQDNNYYEGTFVTGTLPYFAWVDAQITYRPPKTKSTFRVGGTNLGNNYYRTGFGSPYVGGLYYISYGWNIF